MADGDDAGGLHAAVRALRGPRKTDQSGPPLRRARTAGPQAAKLPFSRMCV